MSHQIIQPEGWAPAKGYANGVLSADGHLFVGGQIGWTAEQKFECHDFIGQMKQALQNIREVVEAAGGTPEDITRLTWYVTDRKNILPRKRTWAVPIVRSWASISRPWRWWSSPDWSRMTPSLRSKPMR